MALVDYAEVLLDLKEHLLAKNSHGQRDLLGVITRLEVKHRVEEGFAEKAVRLFGDELQDALTHSSEPAPGRPRVGTQDGSPAHSLSDPTHGPKEDSHARSDRSEGNLRVV